MNRSLVWLGKRAVRLALAFAIAGLLFGCIESGTSDAENEGTNNTNNPSPSPTPTPNPLPGNPPPGSPNPLSVNLGPDITLSSPGLVRLNAGSTNGTYFQWSQISNGTTVNLLNADTRIVSFITPQFSATTPLETRNVTLRLTVSDDNGFEAYDDIIITVPPELQPSPGSNNPPSIDSVTNVIASPGQTVELTATATDVEDGVPSIRWVQMTGPLLGLTLGQLSSDTIAFVAPSQPTKIWFIVEATDSDGDRDLANVLVEVTGNIPPSVNAGGDIAATSQQLVTIQGSASDSDGSIEQYTWQQISGPVVVLEGEATETVSFIAPQVSAATEIVLALTVTDDQGATAEDQVVITVYPILGNVPPTANAGNDQIANLGALVALFGSGTDADGTVISYFWEQLEGPTVLVTNASTQAANFTMPVDMQGQTQIVMQLTVTDDMGASATDQIVVTANSPPLANAGANQSVQAGDTVNLVGSGTDEDGNIASYSWSQINGEPVSIENPNSSTTSFVAPDISGNVTLRLTVTDNNGAIGTDDITISISTTNIPPVADAGVDISVNSGDPDPVVITGMGSDADGQIVAYAWSQISGPTVSLSGADTQAVSFIVPNVLVTSVITLRLTVTDDAGDTGSSDVSITVNASVANNPPQVNAGVDQTVSPGELVTLSGNGVDLDGDSMSYQWSQIDGPSVALNNANSPVASFTAPIVTSESIITVELMVTDANGGVGTDQVVITVQPGNVAPTANAGPDQNANSGAQVTLNGSGNDPDGSVASYQWARLSGPSIVLNNANSANASFTAPVVSSTTLITLRLTVTDNNGATGFDDMVVTVNPAGGGNASPIANAGPDVAAISGSNVDITGSATDDGSITVYIWTQIDGPTILNLINSTTPTVSFAAPAVGSPTNFTLRLTVVDDMGAVGSDDVVVTVSPAGGGNAAPVANAGADRSVNEGEQVSITGSGNDADGSISAYSWTQTNGISVSLGGANTPTVQFTAPTVAAQSAITLRLTVTDNLGSTGSDTVVITVNPNVTNIPPTANAGPDVTMAGNSNRVINGSGQDSDGNIASYQWQQVSGLQLSLVGASSPNLQVNAPSVTSAQTATLRLTVTDNLGASGSDDVVVTVQPANTDLPPVADAGLDQEVNIFDQVSLAGSGTDSDGAIASYQWTQIGGDPMVTLANAGTATASFQAPVVDIDTPYTFELTVTDDAGNTGTDTVVITVHPLAVLSGTITVAPGTQIDSDVNDTSSPYSSNDSIALAQSMFNPVVLGGYANVAGEGALGRSLIVGDEDDYFAISLSANQVINLYIGNIASGANDLDLYLLDQNGQTVDASVSPNAATESLTVANPGTYYINVRAVSGGSNYVLSVGVSTLASQSLISQSNGWRLSDDFKEGDVIVRFKDSGFGTAQSLSSRASSVSLQAKAGAAGRDMLLGLGNASQKATALSNLGVAAVPVKTSTTIAQEKLDTLLVAKALAKRSDVTEAGLNYRYYPTAIPNDTNYNLQWHYPSINLPQAWDITTGSPNVIVAVIDTGVLLNHPDLQGQLVPGYDFIADNANSGDGQNGIDSNPNDPGDGGGVTTSSFHGTHVSGTIAAASNNNLGVAGVAWGVKIMPCRAVGINGGLRYDIEQCVRFAAGLSNDSGTLPAQRADIINLSLGGPTNTTTAPAAYRDARNQGVIVVAAAGNDASNALFAPAAYNGVVSVSATNINRQLASYSNFGSTIDVAAPGGASGDLNGDGFFDGVLSTGGDDSGNGIAFTYRFAAGTSMAAPHMAGVAALMKSVYPDMTPQAFDTMLANGELTDDAGTAGRDNSFGYGIINAQKAVQAAVNVGAPAPPTPPPPAPAVLQVSPTSLNFGASLSNLQINIANAGEAALDITAVTNDSGGWLTVSPATVDATGVGSYDVSINRNGLLEGVYTATITVQSSAGSDTVSVIMQVTTNVTADAGIHYVELIDTETMQLFDRIIVLGNNGTYDYTFPGVPFGMYHIRAGSDLDNDDLLCELGEACGAYPTMDIISQHITVDGSVDVMTGLDFTSEFSVNLSVGAP
jgi:serine protease